MKEYIINNWPALLVLLIFLCINISLVIAGRWETLRKEAYKIMLLAERAYADTEGQAKFNAAFITVYNLLPAWLKLFIPPKVLKKWLQGWYDTAMDQLDDGKINNSNFKSEDL